MAKLDEYQQYIQEMLGKYASYKPAYGEVEVETIFDTVRGCFKSVCECHAEVRLRSVPVPRRGCRRLG
jgi:XisI protein